MDLHRAQRRIEFAYGERLHLSEAIGEVLFVAGIMSVLLAFFFWWRSRPAPCWRTTAAWPLFLLGFLEMPVALLLWYFSGLDSVFGAPGGREYYGDESFAEQLPELVAHANDAWQVSALLLVVALGLLVLGFGLIRRGRRMKMYGEENPHGAARSKGIGIALVIQMGMLAVLGTISLIGDVSYMNAVHDAIR